MMRLNAARSTWRVVSAAGHIVIEDGASSIEKALAARFGNLTKLQDAGAQTPRAWPAKLAIYFSETIAARMMFSSFHGGAVRDGLRLELGVLGKGVLDRLSRPPFAEGRSSLVVALVGRP
jgi:hypothetical protein